MHISGMLCSILHGLGKAKQVLFVNLLTCAIRILMIMLLVPHYGIDAYLWAMLVSHVFMTLAVGILTCHTAHKLKKPAHTPGIPEYVQTHKNTDYTRERYSPVLVSILITSSVSTKSGT